MCAERLKQAVFKREYHMEEKVEATRGQRCK